MYASTALASLSEVVDSHLLLRPSEPVIAPPAFSSDGLSESIVSRGFVSSLRHQFDNAAPFPHLVFDGLFDPELLEQVAADYGRMRGEDWIKYDNANEVKFGTKPNVRLGPGSQAYFDLIHRAKFTQFLTAITGIEALLPDPMLRGGGLHEIPVGGKFAVHTDFTRHVDSKLDNRLVFITYLNKNWQEDWGGALELWSASECIRKIVPVFGRSILFAQSANSLHGHPDPVATPDGRTRRSVAAYYYTNGRPDPTPPERIGTRFLNPATSMPDPVRQKLIRRMKYVLPPALLDAMKWLGRA